MKQPSKKIRFNAEDSARQVSECGLNKRVVIDLLFMNTFATHRHFCVVVSSASHPPPHHPAGRLSEDTGGRRSRCAWGVRQGGAGALRAVGGDAAPGLARGGRRAGRCGGGWLAVVS